MEIFFLMTQHTSLSLFGQLCCQFKKLSYETFCQIKNTKEKKKKKKVIFGK